MYELIAMALALTLLVALLHLRVKLGRSMVLSAVGRRPGGATQGDAERVLADSH